jgi:hypothetical protein
VHWGVNIFTAHGWPVQLSAFISALNAEIVKKWTVLFFTMHAPRPGAPQHQELRVPAPTPARCAGCRPQRRPFGEIIRRDGGQLGQDVLGRLPVYLPVCATERPWAVSSSRYARPVEPSEPNLSSFMRSCRVILKVRSSKCTIILMALFLPGSENTLRSFFQSARLNMYRAL